MKKYPLLIILTLFLVNPVIAKKRSDPEKLKVGVMYVPPYILEVNNHYSGICVELWQMISDSLNLEYTFQRYNCLDSLQQDLGSGKLDLSICPTTVTTERIHRFGVSLPFYISNMGIANRIDETGPFIQVMKNLLSWKIIRWLVLILFIASLFATVIWMAEHRKNPDQFRNGIHGVADGIWWAFVTMTTVGYGDKIPKTPIGKALAILWMFFAIGLFFIATGVVSSELTVKTLQSQIKTTHDLSKSKVGTIDESGYAETLRRNDLRPLVFKNPKEGLKALVSGDIDAFVYDQNILTWVVNNSKLSDHLLVYPSNLNLQYFCFLASPENPLLIGRINPILLEIIDGNNWEQMLSKYDVR